MSEKPLPFGEGQRESPGIVSRDLVLEAIRESISGFASELRAELRAHARRNGIKERTVSARIPLDALLQRVRTRLNGLRGADVAELDEELFGPAGEEADELNEALVWPAGKEADESDEGFFWLAGEEAGSDEEFVWPAIVVAIEVDAPNLAELRDRWLPALGLHVDGDDMRLDVVIPPARLAHAR